MPRVQKLFISPGSLSRDRAQGLSSKRHLNPNFGFRNNALRHRSLCATPPPGFMPKKSPNIPFEDEHDPVDYIDNADRFIDIMDNEDDLDLDARNDDAYFESSHDNDVEDANEDRGNQDNSNTDSITMTVL